MWRIQFSERLEVTGEIQAAVAVCKTQLRWFISSPLVFRGDLADTQKFNFCSDITLGQTDLLCDEWNVCNVFAFKLVWLLLLTYY